MTREEALEQLRLGPGINEDVSAEYNDAVEVAIEALEHPERNIVAVVPCGDTISRQAALGMQYRIDDSATLSARDVVSVDDIEQLPPVKPQPKTGHWIQTNEFFINQDGQFIYKFICSECKSLSYFRKSNKKAIGANVCPNCGAKMIESQKSEE